MSTFLTHLVVFSIGFALGFVMMAVFGAAHEHEQDEPTPLDLALSEQRILRDLAQAEHIRSRRD